MFEDKSSEEITIEDIKNNFDIEKERKLVSKEIIKDLYFSYFVGRGPVDFSFFVTEIELKMKNFKEFNNVENVKISCEQSDYDYQESYVFALHANRDSFETDEEVVDRLLKIEQNKAKKRQREKEEYEKYLELHKKYGEK